MIGWLESPLAGIKIICSVRQRCCHTANEMTQLEFSSEQTCILTAVNIAPKHTKEKLPVQLTFDLVYIAQSKTLKQG